MNIFKKSKVRYFLSILTVVSIFAGVIYFAFFRAETAEAVWYSEDWSYRQKVEISNSGSDQTDFQSKIDMDTATLITAGKMQSDCDDIRVTDVSGRLLPHWIEGDTGACNTSSTDIWTKVPSIETDGATIYIYYGNSTVNNVENGEETFEFFDEFNSPPGTNKWQTVSGVPVISSGAMDLSPTAESLPSSAESDIDTSVQGSISGSTIKSGPIWISPTTAYMVYSDSARQVVYSKTTDSGDTWSSAVTIDAATNTRKFSIWYDKWTPGIYGNLIHVVWIESGSDDIEYRNLDTTDDTLSTETVVYAGNTVDQSSGAHNAHTVDITKTRSGNLISCGAIDPNGENGCAKSVNDGATWSGIADIFDGSNADNILLMPGGEADANDIIAVYDDISANLLTIKTYDDSLNSWSESTSLGPIKTEGFVFKMSASQRFSDNHVIVATWNDNNSSADDIDVYDVTNGTTWSALTDAKVNTDNAANTSVFINQQNDDIYVTYRYGAVWHTSQDAYYVKSTDGGTTWGSEVQINVTTTEIREVFSGLSVGFEGGWFMPVWNDAAADDLEYNKGLSVSIPTAEGVISKDTFTQGNYALRFRSKISATTGAGRGRLGFSNTSAFTNDFRADDAAGLFVGLASGDLNLETTNDATTQSSSDYTKDAAYHVNEIRWGSSSITLYEDGTLKATNSTQVPNEASNIRFEKGVDGTLSVDWAFVRKYAATEPSVGSPGSEEKGPGPVAHWKFDEGYGATANDSTINANNGTITNAAWQQEDLCLSEKCLYFDGTGDYITVEDGMTVTHLDDGHSGSGSSITSASISPEPNSLLLVYSVIRKGSDPGEPTVSDTLTGTGSWAEAGGSRFDVTNGGDTRFALHYAQVGPNPDSGTVTVTWGVTSLSNSYTIEQVTGFDPNNPIVQQATAAYAGGTTRTVTLSSFADSVNNVAVGFFNQSQVVSSATPGTGFTELSDIQAGSGSIHTQVSEYKIGEDTSVDVTWTATDGSTGYAIEVAANAQQDQLDFAAADDFTISGWIKHNTQSSGQDVIVAKYESTGADGGYKLLMEADGDITFAVDDENTSFPDDSATSTAATYDDNQWHHVAGVKNGTTDIKLYIDGALIDTDSTIAATGTLANDDALYIGIDGDGSSNDWLGFLDEVKVYPYARSAAQIKTDFAARGGSIGAAAVIGAKDQSYLSNGLQGYWKMDETSLDSCTGGINDACDSSGNSYDGAITTATQVVGKFGNGVSFDGTDDYISMGDIDSFEFTSDFTVAGWVYPTNLDTTAAYMASKGCGAPSGWAGGIVGTSDLPLFNSNSATITGTTTLVNDTWYHLVFSVDASANVSIYVDGQLDNTPTAVTMTTNTSANVNIGGCNDTSNEFEGILDEIRVYSRSFTAKEVRDLYNFAPGPVGYWNFDENTGTTTVNDEGTGQNNGTTNGTMTEDDWVPGKFGSALDFDGTDDGVTVPTVLANPTDFTLSAWIYPTADGQSSRSHILGRSKSTGCCGNVYGIRRDSDNTIDFTTVVTGTDTLSSTTTAPTNQWTYVTVWKSGATKRIYINGIFEVEGSHSGTLEASTATEFFGELHSSQSPTDRRYQGRIDEARFYDYTRTQKQIIEDMNGSHPAGGSPVGSQIGYWKFDEGYGTTTYNSGNGGSSLDGTITDATWDSDGKIDKTLSFDGDTAKVEVSSFTHEVDNQYTLSAWVNYTGGQATVLTKEASWNDGFKFWGSPSSLWFRAGDGTNATDLFAGVNTGISSATWFHLAVTRNSDLWTMYINGIPKFTATDTDIGDTNNSGVFKIGNRESVSWDPEFQGMIDEVKLYNFALTQDEILVDMNAGSSATFSVGQDEAADLTDGAGNPPVVYWNMDENTSTTANDISGSGNTGTLNNMDAADWVLGKYGSALDFDGSNDYVDVGSATALDDINPITISAWIYNRSVGTDPRVYVKANAGGTQGGAMLLIATATPTAIEFRHGFSTNKGRWRSPTSSISTDKWHHIAVTYDNTSTANNPVMYIDGILVTVTEIETPNGTTDSDATYNGIIGNRPDATRPWDGFVDELKIYDYIRTPAQVAYDFNRGAPVAHWKLDECTGTTAYDSAVKADPNNTRNDGTITIGVTGSNTTAGTCTSPTDGTGAWYDGKTGKFNSSLDFDGTDDYIGAGDVLDLELPVTVEAWIYEQGSGGQGIFSSDDNTDSAPTNSGAYYGFWMNVESDNTIFLSYGDGTGSASTDRQAKTSSTAITANTWTHVVGVIRGASDMDIYINGVDAGGTYSGSGGAMATNVYPARIGVRSRNVGYFDGQIDEVKVYNYALSVAQVRKSMNQNSAVRFGPLTGSP